jgi:hypothetical protein
MLLLLPPPAAPLPVDVLLVVHSTPPSPSTSRSSPPGISISLGGSLTGEGLPADQSTDPAALSTKASCDTSLPASQRSSYRPAASAHVLPLPSISEAPSVATVVLRLHSSFLGGTAGGAGGKGGMPAGGGALVGLPLAVCCAVAARVCLGAHGSSCKMRQCASAHPACSAVAGWEARWTKWVSACLAADTPLAAGAAALAGREAGRAQAEHRQAVALAAGGRETAPRPSGR